mgnify:CR=1 FL=1
MKRGLFRERMLNKNFFIIFISLIIFFSLIAILPVVRTTTAASLPECSDLNDPECNNKKDKNSCILYRELCCKDNEEWAISCNWTQEKKCIKTESYIIDSCTITPKPLDNVLLDTSPNTKKIFLLVISVIIITTIITLFIFFKPKNKKYRR